MNTKTKGNRIRNKLMKELESQSYTVGVVENPSRFSKQKDLFGLFDLICLTTTTIQLIQVTCNRPHPHHKFIEFYNLHRFIFLDNIELLQYVWIDHKGWKVFKYREEMQRIR